MEAEEKKLSVRKGSCHTVAKSLLKKAGVSEAPIRIRDVIPIVINDYPGIKFHSTNQLPSNVYALTYREADTIDIAFNNTVSLNRQKFSFAHELGHLYMGHVHGGGAIDFEDTNDIEKEANEFAAELVMPSSLLRSFVLKGDRTIKDVESLFEVSQEALWWRIMDCGLWKHLKS